MIAAYVLLGTTGLATYAFLAGVAARCFERKGDCPPDEAFVIGMAWPVSIPIMIATAALCLAWKSGFGLTRRTRSVKLPRCTVVDPNRNG